MEFERAIEAIDLQDGKTHEAETFQKRSGRPPLSDSKRPQDMAKLNAYRLIRAVKEKNPRWGPKTLQKHFKNDKDFRDLVKQAGLEYDTAFFRAALDHCRLDILASQKSRSENVS
jgi:hypothetical protein